MAKKDIRAVTAVEGTAAVVDRGFEVDTELKNLTSEDKGIKVKLAELMAGDFGPGETSIRVLGTKAAALLTASEKAEMDASAEAFAKVRKAIDAGLLEGVVDRRLSLVVPLSKVEQAAEVLKKAGIAAIVEESLSLSVTAKELRTAEVKSVEQGEALKALKDCVKTDTTYRVKYEKA